MAAELEDVAATLAELEAEFAAQESMATPVIEPTPTPIPTPPTSIPTPAPIPTPASPSPRTHHASQPKGNRRQRRAIESQRRREARKNKTKPSGR